MGEPRIISHHRCLSFSFHWQPILAEPTVQERTVQPTTVVAPSQEPQTIHDLEAKLETIGVDSTVIHKKFGKGTVVKINKNEKFIHIKFTLGEKKFIETVK